MEHEATVGVPGGGGRVLVAEEEALPSVDMTAWYLLTS